MEMASKRDISAEVLAAARDKNSEGLPGSEQFAHTKGLQFFGKMFAAHQGRWHTAKCQTGKASYRIYHFIKTDARPHGYRRARA